jgi:LAGLIDADG endonuclease
MIQEQGNTVGSRSQVDLAYIAGFLDGDGSLMIQLKRRSESKIKTRRVMLTICFYQDSRHEKPLHWIKEVLGIGYIAENYATRQKRSKQELRSILGLTP